MLDWARSSAFFNDPILAHGILRSAHPPGSASDVFVDVDVTSAIWTGVRSNRGWGRSWWPILLHVVHAYTHKHMCSAQFSKFLLLRSSVLAVINKHTSMGTHRDWCSPLLLCCALKHFASVPISSAAATSVVRNPETWSHTHTHAHKHSKSANSDGWHKPSCRTQKMCCLRFMTVARILWRGALKTRLALYAGSSSGTIAW